MTEKRFTITQKEDYFYVRDEVNKKPMGMFEFKQDEFPVYFCFHKIIDLLNKQHEENEQLKQTIKKVCGLLEEEVDLFSDKATEHDINAYIELRELDNKDAYYMATAIKQAIKILKGDVE